MSLQVLVSVMNVKDWRAQKDVMNISSGMVLINQVSEENDAHTLSTEGNISVLSIVERGLSKSRNRALTIATAELCLIADGDITYQANYEKVITNAFRDNPEADIIIFGIERLDGTLMHVRPGRVGLLHSMKVNSKLIAFKRDSVVRSGIRFDERFGAGSDFYMGEENIFLADCRRAGLKAISIPAKIGHLRPHISTWSRERNERYFYIKGRMFARISKPLSLALSAQFALRKAGARNKSISVLAAFSSATRGVNDEVVVSREG